MPSRWAALAILDPMGMTAFRVALAVAALFHLAGNFGVGVILRSPWLLPVQLVVGVSAIVVVARPRWGAAFLTLCVAIPVSAWLEAPFLGNHWLLAASLALTHLGAEVVSRTQRGPRVASRTWATFLPAGRLVLLVAYAFAAFSKLNTGFFDPTTSCAVLYQDQLVTSLGLSVLSVDGHDSLGLAVAVGAATVELSVVLLLLARRTRRWGVLLGMTFHWVLAFDLAQHFWDFSAVLFAAFLLFLDEQQHGRLAGRWRHLRTQVRPAVRRVLSAVAVLAALLVTTAGALGGPEALRGLAVQTGHLGWALLGTGALVLVASSVRQVGTGEPLLPRLTPVMLVVPALVLVNGLTPYLEIKTGYSWNMYSNLRTVAGETNHLLVPATWDTTSAQVDRVRVLESTDPRLVPGGDQEFVWSEFREYAIDHPDETVTYERGGQVYAAASLAQDPAGQGTVGAFDRRVLSFRAVDTSGSERCPEGFGPAR